MMTGTIFEIFEILKIFFFFQAAKKAADNDWDNFVEIFEIFENSRIF